MASAQSPSPQELKRLSLEELLRVEITTVMRVPEPAAEVPAPVSVITQDDIRRLGATSLLATLGLDRGSVWTSGRRENRMGGERRALDARVKRGHDGKKRCGCRTYAHTARHTTTRHPRA